MSGMDDLASTVMAEYPIRNIRKKKDSLQPNSTLRVVRPILNQPSFDSNYGLTPSGPPLRPWGEIKRIGQKLWARKMASKKTPPQMVYSFLAGWFPIISWLPKYEFRRLAFPDLIAGITVGVMNVPQGIAYAMLAELPPVCGLYTSFIPTLFYFAMGTSRQCSLGTFAVVSMMTSKIILDHTPHEPSAEGITNTHHNGSFNTTFADATAALLGNSSTGHSMFSARDLRAIKVAGMAAVMTGAWQLLFGILGFGALTVYLSDQLVQGFTCGSAFHVFSSQLIPVFGVKGLPEYTGPFKIIKTYVTFFSVIGTCHPPAVIISAVTIVILIAIKYGINSNRRYKALIPVPLPAELVISLRFLFLTLISFRPAPDGVPARWDNEKNGFEKVIIGASLSYSFDFEKRYKVVIVKHIPTGMPPLTLPAFDIAPKIIGDTFSLAIVSFAITVTLGMLFANKHNYGISPSQELKAMACGNLVGGFFQCFPSGASLARSSVQDSVGGRTQLVSLVQCLIVLTVILALGPLMEPLPRACLGGIVMVSLFHLLEQVVELIHLWKVSFVDWTIFLVVFLAVLILDVDYGIGIGVAYSIMTVMFRLQKPKVRGLGRMPGTDLYKPLEVYAGAYQRPEVRIVRVDAPIYFANAAYIKTRVYNLCGLNKAMEQMKASKEDTEEEKEKKYAFTNTLVIDDEEEEERKIAQYHRTVSAISATRASLHNDSFYNLENVPEGDDSSAAPISATENNEPAPHVIMDCSEVCFVDVTGVSFLKKTAEECLTIGVTLLLANTSKPVRDMIQICGAHDFIKPDNMFVTVHDAVLYALNAQTGSTS